MKFRSIEDLVKIPKELAKAYTEGVYADTPANKKLGRVGMSYAAYAEKVKGKETKENSFKDKESSKSIKNTIFDDNFKNNLEDLKNESQREMDFVLNGEHFTLALGRRGALTLKNSEGEGYYVLDHSLFDVNEKDFQDVYESIKQTAASFMPKKNKEKENEEKNKKEKVSEFTIKDLEDHGKNFTLDIDGVRILDFKKGVYRKEDNGKYYGGEKLKDFKEFFEDHPTKLSLAKYGLKQAEIKLDSLKGEYEYYKEHPEFGSMSEFKKRLVDEQIEDINKIKNFIKNNENKEENIKPDKIYTSEDGNSVYKYGNVSLEEIDNFEDDKTLATSYVLSSPNGSFMCYKQKDGKFVVRSGSRGNSETKTYNNLESLIDAYKVKGEKDIKEDKSKQEQIKDKSQRMSDEEIKKFGFVKDLVRMNHPGRRQLPKAKEQITESQTYNLERYFDNKTKKIVYEPKSNSFYLVDYLEKDPQKKVTKILKERAFELINKDKNSKDNSQENKEKNAEKVEKKNNIELNVPHLSIFNEKGEEFDLESLSNDTKRKLNYINKKYQMYIDKISKSLESKSIKEKFNPICLNVDKNGNIIYDSEDIFGGEGIFSYGRILNNKGEDIDREEFFTISSNLKNSLGKWIEETNKKGF